MIQQSDEDVMMRGYLLGDLDETLQEEVEERVLCDGGFAERLSVAQDNLIDDYVFDGLSEGERKSFQKNFILNDERRNKILIAQALEIQVSDAPERQRATANYSRLAPELWRNALLFLQRHKVWVTLSLTAALLLVFLGPKISRWLLPNKTPSLLDGQRASIERQIAELNRHPSLAANQATLELALQPTLLREGDEIKKVALTGDIKLVNLKLELPPVRYERYRAVVHTVEGVELFAVDDLKAEPGGGVILLRIPSEFLSTSDYQIELQGISADGITANVAHYDFRIIKSTTSR